MSYAEKHHNQSRIDAAKYRATSGSGKTVATVNSKPIISKKIAKQREEIAERQRDLQEARKKGDADKINKRQHNSMKRNRS
ncbi:DUF1090 domain-containing protein [Klebsiella pneumoniae]|nr:DUF1090 domain-containing protein [Klebsiella pneumoniae]